MPLEIRELIIRVTVQEKQEPGSAVIPEEKILEIKNSLIAECLEKVLLKLERLTER